MSIRMIKLYIITFFEKFKMKYITHEIVNEDIFPLYEKDLPKEKWTKEQIYEFLEG